MMNIMEAHNCMEQGFKITHETFTVEEFLYIDDRGVIRDEKGYDFTEGWISRLETPYFADGWYKYNN